LSGCFDALELAKKHPDKQVVFFASSSASSGE